MSYYPQFAELLNQYLNRNERSAAWLANRLGVSRATVSRWLNGETRPRDPETVQRIADVLGLSIPERQELLVARGYGVLEPVDTPQRPENTPPVPSLIVGHEDAMRDLKTPLTTKTSRREATLRYAKHYSAVAASAMSSSNQDWDRLDIEWQNINVAVGFCLADRQWQLLAEFTKNLGRYWLNSGRGDTLRESLQSLLYTGTLQDDIERAEAFVMLAELEEMQGNYDEARNLMRQQILILDQSRNKDIERLGRALEQAVGLAKLQGDDDETLFFLGRLLNIARNQRNAKEQVNVLLRLAEVHQRKKEVERANSLCVEATKIARTIRFTAGIVDALRRQGAIHQAQQSIAVAKNFYQEALAFALTAGDRLRADEIREKLRILEAIMQRDIFISYNHHDRDFVTHLARDLKQAGLSVWWDEWEIKVGDSIIQKVSEGIKQSAFLAVALSPHSVQSSWVQRELGSALMQQLSMARGITILPLLVCDCEIPVLLREIKYADFRKDYQMALQSLLNVFT